MTINFTCRIKYSELTIACLKVWGPRAWVAGSLIRLLEALGIGVDYGV